MDKATKQTQPERIEDLPVEAEQAAEVKGGRKAGKDQHEY